MPLLIDGYNLMYAAGLIPRGIGPGTLERARRGLLNYLVHHLPGDEVGKTVIVFDAKDAPSDAAAEYEYRGLRILFARDHDEADDLIEQLIQFDSAPRQLTVVTSDWRLRTAAQRRRARSIKSDDWLDEVERQFELRPSKPDAVPPESCSLRHLTVLNDNEVTAWLEEFGLDRESPPEFASSEPTTTDTPFTTRSATRGDKIALPEPAQDQDAGAQHQDSDERKTDERTRRARHDAGWGPFPPGYGEDLLEEADDES